MKRINKLFLLTAFLLCMNLQSRGQRFEAQQLLLNVEKLAQLKSILSDMKQGYKIISQGYEAVKNISQGNFSLHEVFLDGLLLVNPEIKKYSRVADIISSQKAIISEYKSAFNSFSASGNFNEDELNYLNSVYQQLFNQSIHNLDELLTAITASKLRMSDDERLKAIDRIFADTQEKLQFLRIFNREVLMLNLQRAREKKDVSGTQKLYRIY